MDWHNTLVVLLFAFGFPREICKTKNYSKVFIQKHTSLWELEDESQVGLHGGFPTKSLQAGEDEEVKETVWKRVKKSVGEFLWKSNNGGHKGHKVHGGHSCPPRCSCHGGSVNCGGRGFVRTPDDISTHVNFLHLDRNSIADLKKSEWKYQELIYLDISHNRISEIPARIFANMSKLETLLIQSNFIQCVRPSAFRGLSSLKVLSLQKNNMTYLTDGTFDSLQSLSHLVIGDNPLACDCHMTWLSIWLKGGYRESGTARCSFPPEMKNKLLLTTDPEMFVCSGEREVDEKLSQRCGACRSGFCLNVGTCRDVKKKEKSKKIKSSIAGGSRVEWYEEDEEDDEVGDDDDDDAKYECSCPRDFVGARCQMEVSACFDAPCLHGGKCMSNQVYGRFECICRAGYEGERCNVVSSSTSASSSSSLISPPPLLSSSSPSSSPPPTSSPLSSPSSSPSSSTSSLPRSSSPSSSLMTSKISPTRITAHDRTTSKKFRRKSSSSSPLSSSSPPLSSSSPPTSLSPQRVNYSNENQNASFRSTALRFSTTESFISIPFGRLAAAFGLRENPAVIDIVFSTAKSHGLLLLSDHVVVEMWMAKLLVSCYFRGRGQVINGSFDDVTVNDGLQHKLVVTMSTNKIGVRLDDILPRTFMNDVYYDVTTNDHVTIETNEGQQLFVGGVPHQLLDVFSKLWNLRSSNSFNGCIFSLRINSLLVDVMKRHVTFYKIKRGCRGKHPDCNDTKCKHGKCRMMTSPSSAKTSPRVPVCVCPPGYAGHLCEIESTCHTLHYYDYYVDPVSKCRSKVKIARRKCMGSCNASRRNEVTDVLSYRRQGYENQGNNATVKSCCRPYKVHREPVRLVCSDGTRVKSSVTLVKNCRCVAC